MVFLRFAIKIISIPIQALDLSRGKNFALLPDTNGFVSSLR